ncbi:MAG TPA: DUF6599 family protein [Polyangiaceae bacterium]|jgi:hypothetical protein|nr:DUF6599 family protein [Polyangiaceae bacterium]
MKAPHLLWAVAFPCLLSLGCKRDDSEDKGVAPPPIASAKPGVCANGGGTDSDTASAAFFPRAVGGYCIDPNGDTRAYGEGAKGTLDDVCIQQLDGECDVYKSYGLKRLVSLRYADGAGTPGAIAVTLSRFATKEGSFGFYTKRVVADGDPSKITLTALDAGGISSLGSGVAYVFRNDYLAELAYTNEAESPDQMRESGKRVLPGIAKAIGEHLPGDTTLPAAVQLLPAEHRLPMGVSYVTDDVLRLSGVGPGAVGFYADGDKRWRVVSLLRTDEDAASDVLETLRKAHHATVIKDLVFPAVAASAQHDDAAKTEWVFGRKGSKVFGVGDEELVLGEGKSKDEETHVKLSRDEKLAILKKLVSG